MDISSLKGLLRNGKGGVPAADLSRALYTLIAGLAQTAVEGSDEELVRFRESMLGLAEALNQQTNGSEIDTTVSQTLESLRFFNERAARNNSAKSAELKTVMRTMTDTITFLSESRTRSVHQLRFMQREMEQASQLDDIRLLRGRLMACLEVVRDETARLQEESETRSSQVRQQLDHAIKIADQPVRYGTMDNVTGLPTRRAAESAIRDAAQQGATYAACVFVVERLAAINSKYGRAVGDEIMLRVANHFAQHLSASTLLYRWSGPAFLSLATLRGKAEDVERSWAKAAGVKQEISLQVKERVVFVMVATAMHFHLITNDSAPEDLFRSLDQFVAEHAEVAGASA